MHLQDEASCSNFAIAGFLFLHFAFTLAVASTACPFFCIVEAFFSCSFYVLYIFFFFFGDPKGLELGWNSGLPLIRNRLRRLLLLEDCG